MNQSTHTFDMSDGVQVAARIYTPIGEPKGHIHLLHGMAEHQKRYEGFATMLTEAGYYVSSHDHRGHGDTAELNGQLYGYFADKDGFERVVQDVDEVMEAVQAQIGEYPLTLFGHSMGSFVARRYTQLHSEKIAKAIYCGTGATTLMHAVGVQLASILTKFKGAKTPSSVMNVLSFGSFNKGIKNAKTNFDWLSTDEKEVKKYIDDPQCGFVSTNQFFVDLTSGLVKIADEKETARIRKDLPLLLIAGSEDPVGNYGKGIYKVANSYLHAGIENVTVYLFENMRHEILNEKNKQQVYDVVSRWIEDERL